MATMAYEINELLRNHVKERLGRGEVVASMTVRLIRRVEIARIAKTAGFDSLYVDLEHSSFSLDTTSQICIAALEAGITPLVRVPGGAQVAGVRGLAAVPLAGRRWCGAPGGRCGRWCRPFPRAAKIPAARAAFGGRTP